MMPEVYMSKFSIPETHPLIQILAFQEQLSVHFAHKAICVHEPHRDVLCRRGTSWDKITVLPNVPDPRIFRSSPRPLPDDSMFRIVYHGTIAKRLGLDLAVRAFAKAASQCPRARFEIYGTGDASEDVVQEIHTSGVQDKIHFSRMMFRVEDIAEMIRDASVGIVPNRRDVATEYMLPVKLLEYAHLGIPVVAPRLKTIEYYFGSDVVEYYEPGDVDQMAKGISRLYADSERRNQLARNAKDFSKVFCWDVFKESLFKVIDDAPESQRHPGITPKTMAHS
jgi:glycosyltransferase involved in cell wall biosynthesis